MIPIDRQTQTERLAYTLQHNSWHAQADHFKIRVMRELLEISQRLDAKESSHVAK